MSAPTDPSLAPRGKFIVLEGGDGCGKSTQARLLAESIGALVTREPGGSAIGERIRSIVLDPDHPELAERTEALLMAADRAQHVAEVITPTLDRGQDVVSDRYIGSSLAYQAIGRGLGLEPILTINQFATGGLIPDVIFLLDIDHDEAAERMGTERDRIESSGVELANTVRNAYLDLAAADPDRWVVIDAAGDVTEVEARIRIALDDRLG